MAYAGYVEYFNFISVGTSENSFCFSDRSAFFHVSFDHYRCWFLIHVYSTSYMHEERTEHFGRYFSYLNLFVFSMLLLVMGANYVIMFIGWEGVGLCSYLLIGYWFKNTEYNNAANKAFIMNRIGDLGFLIAIFWMIVKAGSLSITVKYLLRCIGKLQFDRYYRHHSVIFVGATVKVHRFLYIPGCRMRWQVPHLYQH